MLSAKISRTMKRSSVLWKTRKHLTNTRSSGSDDALRLIPVSKLSLEGCLEFLAQDELLEVTPENLRIRKQILNHDQRMKAKSKLK